jgi:hypothetical protein
MVHWSAPVSEGTSSQATGTETPSPGRDRAEYAETALA